MTDRREFLKSAAAGAAATAAGGAAAAATNVPPGDRVTARPGSDFMVDVLKTLDRAAVSYQIVLTKADQVKQAELSARVAEAEAALARHPAAFPNVLATSSRAGTGLPELRGAMVRLLSERRP